MTKNLIKELEQNVEQIEEQLAIAEANLLNAKLARVKKLYGINCGVVVISEGKKYKVVSIDVRWDGRPWVKGYGLKKDGTWGSFARNLFDDWKLEK